MACKKSTMSSGNKTMIGGGMKRKGAKTLTAASTTKCSPGSTKTGLKQSIKVGTTKGKK